MTPREEGLMGAAGHICGQVEWLWMVFWGKPEPYWVDGRFPAMPFDAGQTAHADGRPEEANPHLPFMPAHDQWAAGWVLAERCAAWEPPSINDEHDRRVRMWEYP
jgi:hypothetical protein